MAQTPMQMFDLTNLTYKGSFWFTPELLPLNSNFLWMNLGQPDQIAVSWLPFAIPIMAIIVAITTYIQSKLITPPTADPGDQTAQMSKMMALYMPLFMGYLAYTLASGLALYFVVSNLVGILQYAIMGNVHWENLLPKKKPQAYNKKA
jgi:YidC/Oxa1 family membrane protein insertase